MEKSKERVAHFFLNRATLFWQFKATVGDKVGWVRPAQRMSQLQEPYPERNSKEKKCVKKAPKILCSYQEQDNAFYDVFSPRSPKIEPKRW